MHPALVQNTQEPIKECGDVHGGRPLSAASADCRRAGDGLATSCKSDLGVNCEWAPNNEDNQRDLQHRRG